MTKIFVPSIRKEEKFDVVKILFLGSPEYSSKFVEEISKEFSIIGVITNPPSISDRSRKLKHTPVGEWALEKRIPLWTPTNLKDPNFLNEIKDLKADIFLVFSYGKILPKIFLDLAKYSINLHGSLLPDLRGASPLQTAIMNGYKKSGWTLQKISLKMDEGDILDTVEFNIEKDETLGELMIRVLPLGIELTKKVLKNFEWYWEKALKQDSLKATYCKKIDASVEKIDWKKTKEEIHNLIRALNPNPIAKSDLLKKEGKIVENIKIYRTLLPDDKMNFMIHEKNISDQNIIILKQNKKNLLFAKTINSWLQIIEIQYPNKNKLSAHEFVNGRFIEEGDRFI